MNEDLRGCWKNRLIIDEQLSAALAENSSPGRIQEDEFSFLEIVRSVHQSERENPLHQTSTIHRNDRHRSDREKSIELAMKIRSLRTGVSENEKDCPWSHLSSVDRCSKLEGDPDGQRSNGICFCNALQIFVDRRRENPYWSAQEEFSRLNPHENAFDRRKAKRFLIIRWV